MAAQRQNLETLQRQLRLLFDKAPTRKFPRGQILIYEGDAIDKLYYIISGYIKVYNILESGTERTIFIYGPDDIFPFTSYLSGAGITRYFYECLEDSELLVVPSPDFENKIRGNLEIGEALITYTNSINDEFLQRIDILSVNSARRKVIALLVFLVDKTGTDGPLSKLQMPLTTQDIADMCGLTRETTSLQLVRLRGENILSGTARNLIINKAKLEKLKQGLAINH